MKAIHSPTHHPACDTLVRFAAGRLGAAMQLFVASHLALCPRCRHHVGGYEADAGAGLEALPPLPLPTTCLSGVLRKIALMPEKPVRMAATGGESLPESPYPPLLWPSVGVQGAAIAWAAAQQNSAWGVVPAWQAQGLALALLRVEAGWQANRQAFSPPFQPFSLPQSQLLLLEGSLATATQPYQRGDVMRTRQLCRSPRPNPIPALCLVVTPLAADVPTLLQRLMNLVCGD